VDANRAAPVTRAVASALIDAAGAGHKRMLIIGDPGIGKSTLIDAAAGAFGAAGVTVLRASPSFAERYTAYSMLWDLLNDLDWRATTGLSDEYRCILEIALGRQRSTTELPTLATAIALESILVELSAQAPVVLLIDDLQWSDPESLAAVDRSVRRLADHAVSLVATSREYGSGSSNAPDTTFVHTDVHQLDGLTVDELELLMRPRWPSTLTRAQVVAVREHTGGNPMWALELIERGAIGDLGAVPVGSHRAPLPLAAAVADRLRTLSPTAADVVSIVALLGRPSRALLTDVLRFSGTPSAAIDEAETAGFLALTTQTVCTRHPLQASAAAARLGPARRRELHAFIARAVDDPVVRAQHLQRSQPSGPDDGIAEALAEAAIVMRRRGARLRSAHFDAQAVERTDPAGAAYQDRLLTQAQNLFSAGDHAACVRALSQVTTQRLNPHQYDVYLALSTSSLASRDVAAAIAFVAAQSAEVAGNSIRSALVRANTVAVTPMTVSQRARMSAAAFADLADVDAPNAAHRALRGTIRSRLEGGEGLDHAMIADLTRRQSIQIVVGLDDTGLATTGYLAHQIDDVATSRRAFADLAAWARTEGKEGVERAFLAQAVLVELVGGDLAAARDGAERLGLPDASPALSGELQTLVGLLLIDAGRHDDLAALVDVWRRTPTGAQRELELSALLGFSALARRRWPAAVEHLREAAEAADALELVEPGSRFRVDLPLIEALLQTGETAEAADRLAAVSHFLVGHDRPISQIGLHRVRSLQLASTGDLEAALAEATLAVDLSARQHRPADEVRALLQRARVRQRLRQVTLARTDLDTARDRAVTAGSADLLEQVDAALGTARHRRGPTELTAAEARVHALVQTGLSNKEIAAELYVSVRTVESHVASVLRKSGEPSRAKLITRG
jgi:DNA-binding CsgD family transcriptional regulator